jgi:hypothetical protein
MNKGEVKMYKKCEHYTKNLTQSELENEIIENYTGETDLVRSLMISAVREGWVKTRHELGVANECLWSLNDWPEEEGFGSSDRSYYLNDIKKTIDNERAYHKAEAELVAINQLEEAPKFETVRAYMKMNEKLAEGMVA